MSYAEVSLFAPVYQPYTYAVPPAMAATLRVGCRVVVPLGGGHANGVVTALPESPPAGVRMKEILAQVDDEPLVDPPRLELARWLADYYFAPPGECIRLFYPPGSYVETAFAYTATAAGRAHLAAGPAKTFPERVLALVAARPGVTLKEIGRTIAVRGLERTLAGLERSGWVSREAEVLGARTGFRRVRWVELLAADVDPAAYPVRQRAVLEFLRSHQGPLPQARVVREAGAVPAVLQSLAKKGLLRVYEEESLRDPFHGYEERHDGPLDLTAAQRAAVDRVRGDLAAGAPGQYLLFGVTGSGKTQVYIELIHAVLAMSRTALVLVPEIALTPALTRRFLAHFGARLAILHSMLSDGERHDQWFRIHRGEARVVIGTRSALFAPLDRLGLLVMDEEHDPSYKQDETPRYHARDAARRWARSCGAALVLGSATPSLESYHAATTGQGLTLLELPERIERRPLPEVILVDMTREFERHGKNVILAGEVHHAVAERMQRREQVMVLLNRRGYAPVVLCRKCGADLVCAHCAVSLTFHHREQKLLCHYCGYLRDVPPECPECGSKYLFFLGTGTEKLEEAFRQRFPGRVVARFDRDTTRRRGQIKEILDRFERREIDLLVGTQMIAKGHDFPAVTLVVVLSTDTSLRIPDLRAAERTFQLLTQVAGRSGRGDTPGQVYIQTYFANHYAVRCARRQDYRAFYDQEIGYRRQMFFPPFTRLVFLVITERNEGAVRELATAAGTHLREAVRAAGREASLRVAGPMPALLEKVQDEWRWSLLVRCLSDEGLGAVLHDFRRRCTEARLPFQRIAVDVDPMDLV